jgi:hypothetical protein
MTSDRARATIYPENNNPSVTINASDGSSHPWTPGNPYVGPNDFLLNISNSLDFILDNGLGNYQLKPTIGGHIINDFFAGGALSFADIQIIEAPWGTTIEAFPNGQVVMSNGRAALKIFEGTNSQGVLQEEGYIPPFVILLHEMAHAWLSMYDPNLKNYLTSLTSYSQKLPIYPQYGLSGHNYTSHFEHDLILEKLENPACEQFMFGVRKYYRNAVYADASQQAIILTIQQNQITPPNSDIFYKAANSLTVQPE